MAWVSQLHPHDYRMQGCKEVLYHTCHHLMSPTETPHPLLNVILSHKTTGPYRYSPSLSMKGALCGCSFRYLVETILTLSYEWSTSFCHPILFSRKQAFSRASVRAIILHVLCLLDIGCVTIRHTWSLPHVLEVSPSSSFSMSSKTIVRVFFYGKAF